MVTILLQLIVITAMLYVLWGIPLSIIFQRAGLDKRWAILSIVPGAIVVLLWYLAYAKWPAEPGRNSTK